jgi:hypothetical protein
MKAIQVTVSGSFRQAMGAVQEVVEEFADRGAFVLSPADPRIVDQFGDFVFVASDQVRHLRTVQSRHLASIGASDFLWLVAPEGYVGVSAAMEIGFAAAHEIPVFSDEVPSDLTLRQWVDVVPTRGEAMRRAAVARAVEGEAIDRPTLQSSVLLNPAGAIQASHDDLLVAQRGLLGTPDAGETDEAEAALRRIHQRTLLPS